MKKANPIRSTAAIMLMLFLFTSILSLSFNALTHHEEVQKFIVSKKSNTHSKTEIQLPYEEREKEEENESDDERNDKTSHNLVFIRTVDEIFLYTRSPLTSYFDASHSRESASEIPLYLSKRTLLI